jgi:AraC-like DNA-binding protein
VNPIEVRFQHARPRDVSELERFFACPLHFDQPDNALVLSQEAMELPLITSDPELRKSLAQRAAAQLECLGEPRFGGATGLGAPDQLASLVEQVRVTVCEDLTLHPPSIQRVARRLAVSTRSLQRRLSESGTSFRDLVDAIRHQQALSFLHAGVPFDDIAERLGFSETRAFRRAFRRWTGQSPSRWLTHLAA